MCWASWEASICAIPPSSCRASDACRTDSEASAFRARRSASARLLATRVSRRQRVGDAGFDEALLPQRAGITLATGRAIGRGIVAARSHRVVDAKRGAPFDNRRLGETDER